MGIDVTAIGFAVLAVFFQHPIHELSHAFAARLCGIKVVRIQWYTYHGGTRVFFDNEPENFSDENVDKKWLFIAGAGFLSTSMWGYLFAVLYFLVSDSWLNTMLKVFSSIFLVCDSLYLLYGSIRNFGDIVGIREILKIPNRVSVLICAVIFVLHCMIIYICFLR